MQDIDRKADTELSGKELPLSRRELSVECFEHCQSVGNWIFSPKGSAGNGEGITLCRHSPQLMLRLHYVFIAAIRSGRYLNQRGHLRRTVANHSKVDWFGERVFIGTNPEALVPVCSRRNKRQL